LSFSHSAKFDCLSHLCSVNKQQRQLKTEKMKKTKITFWTVTGVFSAFMLFSSIPDVLVTPEAREFMGKLGYPGYILPFLGVMKLAGVVAILTPGRRRIKEWAYAGLFFDLLGATYSQLSAGGMQPQVLFMALPIALLFISYFYSHKVVASANLTVDLKMATL